MLHYGGVTEPESSRPPVTLREITEDTVIAIIRLKVAPEQERFVAENAVSLSQALFAPYAWYRAIYFGETPVGFVMISDDSLLPEDQRPEEPGIGLWRFMVDHRYQRQGIGEAALRLVLDHARSRGAFSKFTTSYVPGDGSPVGVYERAGFKHTGEVDEDELVMEVDL